jgi:hypothetical protein
VVAVEGEEGGKLHPSGAKLHVGIAVEAACIDTEHGDAEVTISAVLKKRRRVDLRTFRNGIKGTRKPWY